MNRYCPKIADEFRTFKFKNVFLNIKRIYKVVIVK